MWSHILVSNDRNRLKQVLANLISNAIKFTFEGGVTVIISESKKPKKCLKLQVSDTGTGMPTEIQKNAFKPFSTFGNKYFQNIQGVGLGLGIV
jgi:tubulin-specific chaperone A